MKRYYADNISPGPVAPDDEVHCVYMRADIQSHARALLAVVEGMPHSVMCAVVGGYDGIECNCRLGEALRLIGEVLK